MAAKKIMNAKEVQPQLLPSLIQGAEPQEEEAEGDGEPKDQACYEFNESLPTDANDRKCRSCRKYLTTICDQIEHFIDEDGDVE